MQTEVSTADTPNAPFVPKRSSSGTMTVACNLPNGFMLQLHQFEDVDLPLLTGGFKRERHAKPIGEPIKIYGWRAPRGEAPKVPVVGRYALTPNVPADVWEKWVKDNENLDMVKNHCVFAHPTPESTRAAAKEHKNQLSGLEPLNMARTTVPGTGGTKSKPADPRLVALARITTYKKNDDTTLDDV